MKLTVKGMGDRTGTYRYLWGFYVRGYKPWKHCQPCFVGARAEGINPNMLDGPPVELNKSTDFFYLCGVAKGPAEERGKYNLHLAVRPKEGCTATVKSAYGPEFVIEGAEAIEIPTTNAPRSKYTEFDYRCKNMLFASKMYDAAPNPDAEHVSIKAKRSL